MPPLPICIQCGSLARFGRVYAGRLSPVFSNTFDPVSWVSPCQGTGGEKFFDLRNGVFVKSEPSHPYVLAEPYVGILNQLTRISLDQLHEITIKREQRRYLLEKIIDYYRLHIDNFGEIRSHSVLEEVLA